ncbi:hypothetical protein Pcinc_015498 [Petrolisthes cinctipes]|uniref:PHD-type domain-containing protein n=1 Tax=Petrolisthes cinctipes TaxID=88211 RepID=A0AAE1FUB4_PETCI|nr:hypothetical protein Pcinc_015498 [Petrolisthes cinctipes]
MADFCLVCQSTVRPRQEGLLCDGCNLWQHRTCGSGISRDQYRTAVKQGAEIDWMWRSKEHRLRPATSAAESLPASAATIGRC